MIDKINTSQILELLRGPAGSKQQSTQQTQDISKDASLQADYVELISKAASAENESIDLHKIKELLNNGQIDNLKNIKLAAENITDSGI